MEHVHVLQPDSLRRKEDQTSRYLAALRNPSLQILGHPRGRIYNYRAGLTADWLRVFVEAAELDKAVVGPHHLIFLL